MENIFFVIFGLLLGGCFYMMFVVPNLKSRKRKAIEVACVRYLAEAVNFENEEKEEKIAIAKNFIEKTYLDSSKSKLEDFERFLANPLSDKEPLFSQIRQLSSIELSFLVETVIEMAYTSGWYEESYNKFILDLVSPVEGGENMFSELKEKYEKINREKIEQSWVDSSNPDSISLALSLMAHAVLVDKSKMVCELDAIKEFISKYDKENFKESVMFVKNLLCLEYSDKEIKRICTDLKSTVHPAFLNIIMDTLFDVVFADGTCSISELNFLKKVANRLNIDTDVYVSFQKKHLGKEDKKESKQEHKGSESANETASLSPELRKAYDALGITEDATDSELKATWRNLMRINHPDLVSGMGEGAVASATKRCQEINKAFELIKSNRKMG